MPRPLRYPPPMPEEIATARAAVGISRAMAAELIMVTAETWSKYERGQHYMPAGLFELFQLKARVIIERVEEHQAKRAAVLAAGPPQRG